VQEPSATDLPCRACIHIDVVRFLVLEMGVDLLHCPGPCVDGEYFTDDALEVLPHHYAALLGHMTLLDWFLAEGGVPVDAVNYEGCNALHAVCWQDFAGLNKEKVFMSFRTSSRNVGRILAFMTLRS